MILSTPFPFHGFFYQNFFQLNFSKPGDKSFYNKCHYATYCTYDGHNNDYSDCYGPYVYTYNDKCLQETVGFGDDIYIIAEINGLLYLSRSAVFSHYEFTGTTNQRITDEIWQKQLLDHKIPAQVVCMNDIKINVPHPKTAPNFNLY